MRHVFVCLLIILGTGGPVVAADAEVYLLSGQSNMQGIGKLKNAPASFLEPMKRVWFWNGTAFEKLDPSTTKLSARAGEFGPELGFARMMTLLKPETEIFIVKFFASGQPLHHGWDRNKWVGTEHAPGRFNFYPGTSADDPNRGQHYINMMSRFDAALTALKKSETSFRVAGLVWMQGEQDSKHEVSAVQYSKSLAVLKSRWEADVDSGDVPFVFGQVLPHEPALERFTHRAEIRRSMENVSADSGHADAVPNIWMQPTERMPLLPDTVHYNAVGQILLGTAFGQKMMQAQSVPSSVEKHD